MSHLKDEIAALDRAIAAATPATAMPAAEVFSAQRVLRAAAEAEGITLEVTVKLDSSDSVGRLDVVRREPAAGVTIYRTVREPLDAAGARALIAEIRAEAAERTRAARRRIRRERAPS